MLTNGGLVTVTPQRVQIVVRDAPAPHGLLALAFSATLTIGLYDGATGVLLPSLQAFYHVGKGVISLLFLTTVFGYLTSSFGSGVLMKRLGQQHFFAFGAATFAAGTTGLALHPPFAVVLVAALLVGFGFATLDAGLNTALAVLPGSTRALNYLHAFYGGGALLGPLIASAALAGGQPWNHVYLIWIISGVALAACFLRLFQPSPVVTPEAVTPLEHDGLVVAVRLRIVQLCALFLLLYVGVEVTVGTWAYSFLTEVRHGNPLHAGWVTSGYWLGLTVGRLVIALMATHVRFAQAKIVRYCLVGVFVGVLLVWLGPGEAATACGLMMIGFSLGPIFPTTIALMPSLVPARLVPGSIGFIAGTGSAGAALFPWLAGVIAGSAGLELLMPYLVVLTGLMTVGWFVFRRVSGTVAPRAMSR